MKFKEKSELLNSLIAKTCRLTNDFSAYLLSQFGKRLAAIQYPNNDIEKVIQTLDPNELDDHHSISTRMIKIRFSSIYKPLELTFKQVLNTSAFCK